MQLKYINFVSTLCQKTPWHSWLLQQLLLVNFVKKKCSLSNKFYPNDFILMECKWELNVKSGLRDLDLLASSFITIF